MLCTGRVWNVWVLDFVQKKFPDTSPGDFESVFIKAGASETQEGLRIEEARSQKQDGAKLVLPWPFGNVEPRQGALGPSERQSQRQKK